MTFATPSNITGLYNVSSYANQVTDGYFWIIFASTIAVILFLLIYNKNQNPSHAFVAGSFGFFITTTFLNMMNLIASKYWLLSVVMLAFGVLALMLNRDDAL